MMEAVPLHRKDGNTPCQQASKIQEHILHLAMPLIDIKNHAYCKEQTCKPGSHRARLKSLLAWRLHERHVGLRAFLYAGPVRITLAWTKLGGSRPVVRTHRISKGKSRKFAASPQKQREDKGYESCSDAQREIRGFDLLFDCTWHSGLVSL